MSRTLAAAQGDEPTLRKFAVLHEMFLLCDRKTRSMSSGATL
jgi:hypothetical protein